MQKAFRIFVFVLSVTIFTSMAFAAGYGTATHISIGPPKSESAPDVQSRFRVFWEVWDLVEREYLERGSVEPEAMTSGAIKGMLQSLGDPHTVYMDPKFYQYEKEEFSEAFGGIGATVTIVNNQITIVAPIEDSPAANAGLRPGDRILRVNGEDTKGMSLTEAVGKIRGPKGTKVKLLILHEDATAPTEVEITRGDVKTVSVYSEMLPGSIARLRITHFSQRTDEEVVQKLRDLRKGELKGVIVDLRDNPGGYLHITVNVASQFLKDGIVCYEEDAEGKRTEWRVRPGGLATDIPIAVLVNKGSASGSEVLAGAIQDHGRGALIGEETFGKGVAQRQYELSDGSAVAVTVSRWLTPKAKMIEGKGLLPDIEVPMTLEEFQAKGDIQLNRAVEYIQTGK